MRFLFLTCLLAGCSHAYNRTVDYVDRDRFMGSWYVIAGRFTSFEDEAFNAVENYKWDEKNKKILISFQFNKGSLKGPLKDIPQTAEIIDEKTNATWKVSPFWPLKFTYLVIGLDQNNYQWTAVGVPNQKYLWIMSRDPKFSKEQTKEVLNYLRSINYSVKDIRYIEHD